MGFIPLQSTPQFLPRIDTDLRAGRWHCVERTQDQNGNWTSEKVEVEKPQFLADLNNCAIGWTAFDQQTKRPDSLMYHNQDGMPTRPTSEHKEGFEVVVKMLGGDFDGSFRKFGKQGIAIVRAFNELVDEWQTHEESKDPNLCPVVSVTGSVAMKAGRSTNYPPTWQIAGFQERPVEFDAHLPERAEEINKRIEAEAEEQEKEMRKTDLEFV